MLLKWHPDALCTTSSLSVEPWASCVATGMFAIEAILWDWRAGEPLHFHTSCPSRVGRPVRQYAQTHYWPDFCQRCWCDWLPLWLERWAVCPECRSMQWKMSRLSLSNCWSFMGEMKVFHVGGMQRPEGGGKKKICRSKVSIAFA